MSRYKYGARLARLVRYASSEVRPSKTTAGSGTGSGAGSGTGIGTGSGRGPASTWTVPLAGAGLLAYWWASGEDDGAGDDGGRDVTLVDDRGVEAKSADTAGEAGTCANPDVSQSVTVLDSRIVNEADTSAAAGEAGTCADPGVSQTVTVLDSRIINELLSSNGVAEAEGPAVASQPEVATSGEAHAASKDVQHASDGGGDRSSAAMAPSGESSPPSPPSPQDHQNTSPRSSPGNQRATKATSLAALARSPLSPQDHPNTSPQDHPNTSPSRLIALSNERPFSLSAEDLDFASRLKQAEADAHVIELVRRSLEARHEGLVSATSRLKETLGSLEAMQQELLLAQSKAQEIRHERTITRERIKRQEVLDSVRIQCDALTAALGAASERYARARELTRLSLSLRRIKDGLLDGSASSPSLTPATTVDGFREQGPLVASALDSLRRNLAGTKPLATLRAQFEKDVRRPATELAYIPEGRGSMVTALLSKIAAGLRADGGNDEWNAIRRRVDAGQLLEASEDLEKLVEGTASARVVRDWVNDVRSTCRALQAIDVLESYCYLNV